MAAVQCAQRSCRARRRRTGGHRFEPGKKYAPKERVWYPRYTLRVRVRVLATWQDRMTSQRVRNEVKRGREALEAGRKEEKRRKKEGGKTVSKGQQSLLALRASMLEPGAGRGPVAHGWDRDLVSCPDGLVQNPGVRWSSPSLVVERVRKHAKM